MAVETLDPYVQLRWSTLRRFGSCFGIFSLLYFTRVKGLEVESQIAS